MRLLLDAGAEVNAYPGTTHNALYNASLNNREAIVRMLLAAGADMNDNESAKSAAAHDAMFLRIAMQQGNLYANQETNK